MTDIKGDNISSSGGGIAWAGSLVGSENPNNLGYRYSTPSKRYRTSEKTEDGQRALPTNVQVQLKDREGKELSDALDLPTNSSVDDLTALVHSILSATDPDQQHIPYAFYASIERKGVKDDLEVTNTIADFLQEFPNVSTETTLQLTYQPLSLFRVRPVTRCTDTLPGHTEAVLHCQYSPDGKMLASGGGDTTVRFWDVNTATPKFTRKGHRDHVLCTAWSPDGKRFVSGDRRGTLIVWDPFQGKILRAIQAHKQWITAMAWEPMHKNAVCDKLATSSKDGTIKIWNVRTFSCLYTLSGHTDSVESIKWGGEGLLYSASRDRTIKSWNPERGILVRNYTGHAHRVNTLALSSDYIIRTGPFDHRGTPFDSVEEAHKAAMEKYEEFRKQGPERLVSGSDDFTLFLWDPKQSKHPIKRLTGHQQAVNHIAFSPDARFFASASFDKKVKIWNGFSGDFVVTLTGHVGAVYQVAWSSDSRYLVSASKDSTAKLWQVPSGKQAQATLPGHADEVYALDWSPNGAAVATGSKDRTIKIWKH